MAEIKRNFTKDALAAVSPEREGVISLAEMALEPWGYGRTRTPSVESVSKLFDTLKQLAKQGYTLEGIAKVNEETNNEGLNGDNILMVVTNDGGIEIKLSEGLELVEIEDPQAEIARVDGLEGDLINGFLFQYINLQIGTRKNDVERMSRSQISEGRTEILKEINRLEAEAVKAGELAYQRLGNKAVTDKWLGKC